MRSSVLLSGALVLAWSAPVNAQMRDGLGSTLAFTGGSMALADRTLEPAWLEQAPGPLQDAKVRLRTPRFMTGGVLRETLILSSVRWSFGVGIGALPGEGARVENLAPGFEVRGRAPWVALFDFSLGRQLRAGPLFPYVEARTALSVVTSRLELRLPSEGRLSVTNYDRSLFELGPRVGFWFPMGPSMHLDVSVRAGLLGPERFGADIGFGFYLPWGPRRRSG